MGGSTVIGVHVWDHSRPQFQMWERFRAPVLGQPLSDGDLARRHSDGQPTPNHVNDPTINGVWRPRDRYYHFEDDPAGNITAVGTHRGDFAVITESTGLPQSGTIAPGCMLTATYGIRPTDFLAGGASRVESTDLAPMASPQASGSVELTTFPSLVETWAS